jgi:hypothetical protein
MSDFDMRARTEFLAELRLGFSVGTMARRTRPTHEILEERAERLVRQLHSRPPGLPDTVLLPPRAIGNHGPRWRTVCAPTVGNYWLSRHWWRDFATMIRCAFMAEWRRHATPDHRTVVSGSNRGVALITGITS